METSLPVLNAHESKALRDFGFADDELAALFSRFLGPCDSTLKVGR